CPSSASAASTTCASTQPPIVTPPSSRPLSPTIIFVPTFFDVLPVADTSVATAIAVSSEISGSRGSIRPCVMLRSLARVAQRVQPEVPNLARSARVRLDQRSLPIPLILLGGCHAVAEKMAVGVSEKDAGRAGRKRADVSVEAIEDVERQFGSS